MPSPPEPPVDTVRVAINGLNDSYPWTNVFWLKVVSGGTRTYADLSTLLIAFAAAHFTHLLPHVSNNVAQQTCHGSWQTGAGTAIESTVAALGVGGGVAQPLPASAAAVLSWQIASRYRGGKPRTYLPGMTTSGIADTAHLSGSSVTTYANDAEAFRVAVNALTAGAITSVTLGTLRRFADGGSETIPPTYLNPPVFWPFLSVLVHARLGTQRRRLGEYV